MRNLFLLFFFIFGKRRIMKAENTTAFASSSGSWLPIGGWAPNGSHRSTTSHRQPPDRFFPSSPSLKEGKDKKSANVHLSFILYVFKRSIKLIGKGRPEDTKIVCCHPFCGSDPAISRPASFFFFSSFSPSSLFSFPSFFFA